MSLNVMGNGTMRKLGGLFLIHILISIMAVSLAVRYSASKNGVTLKIGLGFFNVIENGAVR